MKVNTVHTSLFVSFSVALDKNQTFTNNNVFHKLSRPTLPLQVVYKPWLIRISQGNKKLQHSSLCRIWFVHIWTSYITGRQDSHWTLCVSFGHTFDTIKYNFSILCQCLMRSHARKYLPINRWGKTLASECSHRLVGDNHKLFPQWHCPVLPNMGHMVAAANIQNWHNSIYS